MQFLKSCTALLCLIIVGLTGADPIAVVVDKPALKGLTVEFPPFVVKTGDIYSSGYAVDLMKLIAKEAGFTFTLADSPDGRYGRVHQNGTIDGMLGEVHHKRADFALGDVTVTAERANYVAFSEPFMESRLGAIIKAEAVPAGVTTLKDLASADASHLTLLALRNGATEATFRLSNYTVGAALWRRLISSGGVSSTQEGVNRVIGASSTSNATAYLGQTSSLDYFAGQSCQSRLVVLPDDVHFGDAQYAIGLQKGSAWLEPINKAIRGLKAKGKLAELKAKYWASSCSSE